MDEELLTEITNLETELQKTVKELEETKVQLKEALEHKVKAEKYNSNLRLEIEKLNCLLRLCQTTNTSYEEQIDAETQVNEEIMTADLAYDYCAYGPSSEYKEVTEYPYTSGGTMAPWSTEQQENSSYPPEDGEVKEEPLSIADSIKEVAESAMQQSGYVYDENTGLYYDHKSGYYYDSERQLYYEPNTGTYYYYDPETGTYQFHSQVDFSAYNYQQSSQNKEQIEDVITAMSGLNIDKEILYRNALVLYLKINLVSKKEDNMGKKKKKHKRKKDHKYSDTKKDHHRERKRLKRRRSRDSPKIESDKSSMVPEEMFAESSFEKTRKHSHKHKRRKKIDIAPKIVTYTAKATTYSSDINSRRVTIPDKGKILQEELSSHQTEKHKKTIKESVQNEKSSQLNFTDVDNHHDTYLATVGKSSDYERNYQKEVIDENKSKETEDLQSDEKLETTLVQAGPCVKDYMQHLESKQTDANKISDPENKSKIGEERQKEVIDEKKSKETEDLQSDEKLETTFVQAGPCVKDYIQHLESKQTDANKISDPENKCKIGEEHEESGSSQKHPVDINDGEISCVASNEQNDEVQYEMDDNDSLTVHGKCDIKSPGNHHTEISKTNVHNTNMCASDSHTNIESASNSEENKKEDTENIESTLLSNMTFTDEIDKEYPKVVDSNISIDINDKNDDLLIGKLNDSQQDLSEVSVNKDLEEGEITDDSEVDEIDHSGDSISVSSGDMYSSFNSSETESDMSDSEDQDASSHHWPPCIRIMVKESDTLNAGMLYIVTCNGATIGREQSLGHAIVITDVQVSKMHLSIMYNEDLRTYLIKDHASENGTYLNDQRLCKVKMKFLNSTSFPVK